LFFKNSLAFLVGTSNSGDGLRHM